MTLRNGSVATLGRFLAVISGLIFLAGCGGSSSSSSSTSTPAATNSVPVTVGFGPLGAAGQYYNGIFTSVTVCVPGTSTCQTIPNVLVDSGSVGLRILDSALTTVSPSSLGTITDSTGDQLQECVQFGDLSYVWGSVLVADVKLGGEKASSVPIQVIGDTSSTVPASCFGTNAIGLNDDTVANLGANGILGVQGYPQDCGGSCSTGTFFSGYPYYFCPSGACSETAVDVAYQVWNPVAAFSSSDNNGVLITLPSIPAAGAADGTISGTMIFGVGTQTDNVFSSSATLYALDEYGNFPQVSYNGIAYDSPNNGSFIDSGSNALFVLDATTLGISDCTDNGYYCPSQTLTLSGISISGYDSVGSGTVSLSIANADTLFSTNPTFSAFSNLGGDSGTGISNDSFDFGLPFFFNKTVYIGMMPGTFSGESPGPSIASSATYGYCAF
jgi:hypothetical protein